MSNSSKQRNIVERGFNRLEHRRGIATRYDKHAVSFLDGALLGASIARSRNRTQKKARPSRGCPSTGGPRRP